MADMIDVAPSATTTDATPAVIGGFTFTSLRAGCGEVLVCAHGNDGNKAHWKFGFLAYRQEDDITLVNQLVGFSAAKTPGAALWNAYLDTADGLITVNGQGSLGVAVNWRVELLWGMALAAP